MGKILCLVHSVGSMKSTAFMDEEDQSSSKGSGSITDASSCVSGKPQEAMLTVSQQAEPQAKGQASLWLQDAGDTVRPNTQTFSLA